MSPVFDSTEVNCEILIIGAGLIGSALAASLAERGVQKIRVVDLDLEGTLSSSELNAGGVRATWNQPVNVQMAIETIDYLSAHAEEVGYRDCGYLWMLGREKYEAALRARERQLAMGWKVEDWTRAQLQARVPFIDKFDGIDGILFSPRDGLVNPNLLKNHFRARAKAKSVEFLDRVWLRSARVDAAGCEVRGQKLKADLSEEFKRSQLTHFARAYPEWTLGEVKIRAERVVNCAGAWASAVARMLGYESPCIPVRRQIAIFDSRDVDLTPYGMMIDPSGVYFHPEAKNGLSGFAIPNEPMGINYEFDGESFFLEHIWPALYERSSSFERLRFLTGWAGQYEVSPDESAVIGPVRIGDPGKTERVFESHSYSGHGVMHCYSAAEALADLMVHGKPARVDVAQLNGNRFEERRLVRESQVI